jgi:hypothetical protein
MPDPINVYQGSQPDVYSIGQIYDPAIHTGSLEGLTVPALTSLVVDNISIPGKYILYTVDSVDPLTLASTLVTLHSVLTGVDENDHILNYGNDTMMLFFDDRSTPTRLIVDSKFVLIGSASSEYRLVKVVGTDRVVISVVIDGTGDIIGTNVPIIDTAVPGVRKLSDCHTTHPIVNGEFIELEVYDSTGVLTTRLRLIAKQATVATDFSSSSNPIVGFGAEANQQIGQTWVIYVNQNPEDLTIFPEITYENGTKELIAVDNISTFIYGMEAVDSSIAGAEYHVMIKHFLADDIPSTITQGEGVRFLLYERFIRIVERGIFQYSKIMPIPLWNPTANEWELSYIGYFESRDSFEYLSNNAITYTGPAFDGTAYGTEQPLTINASVDDGEGNISTYQQDFVIWLNGNGGVAPWTIADDNVTPFIYGEESVIHNRPKLNYDVTRQTYFVPIASFPDNVSFLDNFYHRAEPPFVQPAETQEPTPSHFIVRDGVNGRVLTAAPVDIATYGGEFSLISNIGDNAQYNDATVIVEFLLEDGGNYGILFGVPVEVETGTYI